MQPQKFEKSLEKKKRTGIKKLKKVVAKSGNKKIISSQPEVLVQPKQQKIIAKKPVRATLKNKKNKKNDKNKENV